MYLNCHTSFSYKYGTLSIEGLLEKARKMGVKRLALTDINSTSGCIDFVRRANLADIESVIGIDFRNGAKQQFVGLAINNAGFRELNEFLTHHLHHEEPIPEKAPGFNNVFVIYPWDKTPFQALKENEFIGVRPAQLKQLPFSKWKDHQHKLVIQQPVSFNALKDFETHKLLRAMDNNTLLSMLPEEELADPYEIMVPESRLEEIFEAYPQIITNTRKLINQCSIDFDFGSVKNKKFYTNSVSEDMQLIRNECEKGLIYRYRKAPSNVLERMNKELQVIQDKGFASYFLINWDMINYARSQDYYYVGRGSGANSMVAYLLRITDVDPIELDLYFERFINPERANLPDFDIDFSSFDRNDITQYLFDKYGWDRTALIGTYSTFKDRGTLRELGKVYGMPAHDIRKMQKASNYYELDELARKVYGHYRKIAGLPNHLSVHASGVIISEEPIASYTATMMPPKGFPTTHFSMIEAEDVGLHKFDILGQRGLGKIKDALQLVRDNQNVLVDIHKVEEFKRDDKINIELLKEAKTIGCFYVESPAMRMLLTKLRASDYLRLVAASSIIRPGVAQSGMMQEYVQRFHDPERREQARKELPELYDILKETYGVMVYQEDVIKVAHQFAGLSLAEADVLRRGMSWKFRERNEFHLVRDKFFNNCRKKNHPEDKISKLWEEIESFGNYAFAKGHSASYAVESYQALYLKAHYPLEYMVATVNNGGGFYRTELYFHEVKLNGGKLELPCVNQSDALTGLQGKTIYVGLRFVHGLEADTVQRLLTERFYDGPYKSLRDFVKRVQLPIEQLHLLIRIGAFRFTGKQKKELLWDAHFLLSASKKTKPSRTLFNVEPAEFEIPELWSHPLEDAFDEIELLGFPVSRTPFELLEEEPKMKLKAVDLPGLVGETVEIVGYLIHIKGTQTRSKDTPQRMNFGTWLDLDGQWLDTVHFPKAAARYPFQGPGCYWIKGKVLDEFGFISVEMHEMRRLPNQNMETPSVRLRSSESYFRKPKMLK